MAISRRFLLKVAAPLALLTGAGTVSRAHASSPGKAVKHDSGLPLLTSQWGINSKNNKKTNAKNLNKMINHALDTGRLWIDVDVDAEIDDESILVRKKTEVFFRSVGGKLTGLYRRATILAGAPSNVRITNGLRSSGMTQFYLAEKPKVVILGDSISIDGPNALSLSDSMFSIITGEICKQNPGTEIEFLNRAIGGQTWMYANSKPTAFPEWYYDREKDWLEIVENDSPDLIILAFGMNDANGFNPGALHSVVKKINAWSKKPSIIFVTNPLPAISTTLNDNYYKYLSQEGRDWVAGYVRSYANFHGYSLLDINRQFCLIRDGRDYLSAPLERVGVFQLSDFNSNKILARDFNISGDVDSWPEGKTFAIKVGVNEFDVVHITNNKGKVKISAYSEGDHLLPYVDISTLESIEPNVSVTISVQNNNFIMFCNGKRIAFFNMIRTGGEFSLAASWTDSADSGPLSPVTVNVGQWLQCQYTARDSDIWGHDNGTADTKYPEGGNGINHFSSNGLSLIVSPVVEAFDFSRKSVEISSPIESANSGVLLKSFTVAKRSGRTVLLSGRLNCKNKPPYRLFTLPEPFRPKISKVISTVAIGSVGDWKQCILSIEPDGGVFLAKGSATSLLSLDGIFFDI